MRNKPQSAAGEIAKRRGRGLVKWLGAAVALVVGLILAGTIYESVSEAADIRAYPPPGQMVDVGGYRLHINCTGSGSPTVVIAAGWGDWSLAWSGVQEQVSKTTRVCTYDRAGTGYSEAGPLPRNAKQFAQELYTLLERAHIAGPYVMVGHSMGGLTVRVFVHDYPTLVSGAVLIESMSPGKMGGPGTERKNQTSPQSGGSDVPSLLARTGVLRLIGGQPTAVAGLAPEAKAAYDAFSVTPRAVQTWADEGTSMPESLAQAGAVETFGDLPLIVLTAAFNQEKDWQTQQVELLRLSSHSEQVIAEKSGHTVHFEQPDAAVAAIVKMVSQVE